MRELALVVSRTLLFQSYIIVIVKLNVLRNYARLTFNVCHANHPNSLMWMFTLAPQLLERNLKLHLLQTWKGKGERYMIRMTHYGSLFPHRDSSTSQMTPLKNLLFIKTTSPTHPFVNQ
jgi:hypothetical protein